ncbi:MAG: tetratricopeptide repeat protein, partial [Chloroflexi bacterium]|nr:tetratricopeptide repeat protein [Chloroflexota bacterium]
YKGQVYRQQGKYAEAEEEFKESVTINPMFAAAYNALGLTYHDQDRIDQAVEQYLKTIEVDHQFASAYNNLAVAYGVQDKPVEVRIELYLKALEIEPDSFIFHQNLGLLYHGQDRYDEALAEYQEAVQAYPSDADSHYLLASLYADWARWDEAQEACQKALELNPAHAAAHCLLGTLYDDFGNSEQAVAEYQKALEIDPDEATAHRNLGLQYMYKGELELAQAEYEKAVSLDPENAAGQCTMGALYTKIGRIKQGEKLIAECERLVAMNPEDYLGHNALGMVYSAQEKYPQALLEFQQAVRLAPNSYTLHSNLSSAYKEVGRIQEAIEEAEEALRLTPDPFSAHLRLLALHWAARDYREVASELALTWLAATILFKIFSMLCLVILLSEAYVLKDRRRREKAINTIGRLAVRCFLVILLTVRRGLMKTDAGLQASRTKRGQPFISKTLSGINHLIAVFYYILGNASMLDGLEEDALEKWQRALDTDPGYMPAAHGLVNFYTSKRNLPVACRVARQAIRAKPGDAIMHMQLGDIYMALNMTEEAIREWEDAVKIDVDAVISFRFEQLQSDPLLVPAHFTLGLAFRAKEEIDKAVTGFEATISSSYNHILKRRAEIEIQALREAKSKLD